MGLPRPPLLQPVDVRLKESHSSEPLFRRPHWWLSSYRLCTALAGDPTSVPSIHIKRLTASWNSSTGAVVSPTFAGTYTEVHSPTHQEVPDQVMAAQE